jgi:hypothetical protein
VTTTNRSKLRKAAWLSFLVYLLPIQHNHVPLDRALWGLVVWDSLVGSIEHQAFLSFFFHLPVIVVVQATAGLLWSVFLWAHWSIKLVLVPLQFAAITYVTIQSTLWVRMALIPDIKLQAEVRPGPLIPWTETCSFENAYLLGIESNPPTGLWVLERGSGSVSLVEAPDCSVIRTQREADREKGGQEVGFDLYIMGYPWGAEFQSFSGDWHGITRGEVRDQSEFNIGGTYDTPVWPTAFGRLEWIRPHEAEAQYNLYHGKRVRLRWTLSTGRGSYELAAGRALFSPHIHPDGSLITFVSSNNVWRDTVPDEVVVLRVSDGREVFRAHVPSLSRPLVRFVGSDSFAFTDFQDGEPSIRLFRIGDRQR